MGLRICGVVCLLVLVAMSVAIFANSMTKPIGRDEHMYCAGAVLLSQGKMIYRDFSYVAQLPYHPLICAAMFRLFDTSRYLLTVRMLSVVCDILVMFAIVGIYQYVFRSYRVAGRLLGTAGAMLYVFNPLVDYANGFAWNHDVVILCVVISFWLFVATDFEGKRKWLRIAAMGSLLTIATWMRVTTTMVWLVFLVMLLFSVKGELKIRLKAALPFLAGTLVFSAWPVYIIAQAPRAFFLNTVRIPMLNGAWLREAGMVYDKLSLTVGSLMTANYILILIIGFNLYLSVVWQGRKEKNLNIGHMLLGALLPITFFVIAFVPPTMWRQYWAVPVPFIVISFAQPFLQLRKRAERVKGYRHFYVFCILIATAVAVSVASYPVVLMRTLYITIPENWVPNQVHEISKDFACKINEPKRVLTLSPLFAIETGCDIYPELSAGVFVYRIADYLSEDERRAALAVGPAGIGELVDKVPPSAVITGIELGSLEKEMLRVTVGAEPGSWKKKVYDNELVV